MSDALIDLMGTKDDAIPDPNPNEGRAFSSTSVLVR